MTQLDLDNEFRNEQSNYEQFQSMNLSQRIFDPGVEVGASSCFVANPRVTASGSYLGRSAI